MFLGQVVPSSICFFSVFEKNILGYVQQQRRLLNRAGHIFDDDLMGKKKGAVWTMKSSIPSSIDFCSMTSIDSD